MGNGKKKKLSEKEESMVLDVSGAGVYNLVNLEGGYIGVAERSSQEVTGYVVPRNIAALYYRFWSIAPAIQELQQLPNPTKEEFEEIMKRYLNKLAEVHEDFVHDAVMEVLGEEEWEPAKGWNPHVPNKFVQELMTKGQQQPLIIPDKQYDEEEKIGSDTTNGPGSETDDEGSSK